MADDNQQINEAAGYTQVPLYGGPNMGPKNMYFKLKKEYAESIDRTINVIEAFEHIPQIHHLLNQLYIEKRNLET